MNHLKKWWPALGSIWLAYLFMLALKSSFPHAEIGSQKNSINSSGIDSVLTSVQKSQNNRNQDSIGIGRSPFMDYHSFGNTTIHINHAPPLPPPPRHYVLKGTIGDKVATITNNAGRKSIVKVGDKIDSAFVMTIAPNRVELKDRAGTFEILLEK